MPRNSAHRAQRELDRTVRRLRAFCATEHKYTVPEFLWAAVEKNNRRAVFFLSFARLLRPNRKTRHSLQRLKGRRESRAANHFKEEFFNLYKVLRLWCTPQHQDEATPGFSSTGRRNKRRSRRTGLLRLWKETMKQRSAARMLETWHWMENPQVCIWIDNCFIKQYGTHPRIQDQPGNCRVICGVEIPCRLPYV